MLHLHPNDIISFEYHARIGCKGVRAVHKPTGKYYEIPDASNFEGGLTWARKTCAENVLLMVKGWMDFEPELMANPLRDMVPFDTRAIQEKRQGKPNLIRVNGFWRVSEKHEYYKDDLWNEARQWADSAHRRRMLKDIKDVIANSPRP